MPVFIRACLFIEDCKLSKSSLRTNNIGTPGEVHILKEKYVGKCFKIISRTTMLQFMRILSKHHQIM